MSTGGFAGTAAGETAIRPLRAELGRALISYRRKLPEQPLPRLGLACVIEVFAIAVLAIPDFSIRVLFSSTLLAIAVALVYFTLFRSGFQLAVHEYGVELTRGKHRERALFSNVLRIRSSGLSGSRERGAIKVRLELGDGRVLIIEGGDRQLRPACEAILERAGGVIAPRVLSDFYAGEAVEFGAVRMSKTYLSARERRLPLRSIASAEVRRGRFTVISDEGDTFFSMESFEVANLDALLMLLSRVRRPIAAGRSA